MSKRPSWNSTWTCFALLFPWMGMTCLICLGQNAQEAKEKKTPWRGPQPVEGMPWPEKAHCFQRYWFQMGEEFFNPPINRRFRVNDPFVATHPEFHTRPEVRGNGMMIIPFREKLREISAARLYLELWGGHPKSDGHRVSINGRTTYPIKVPSDEQCTHIYSYHSLKMTDLVEGFNALQFSVDGDRTFWGHFIVEEAALDALLPREDPRFSEFGEWIDTNPAVIVESTARESFQLSLAVPAELHRRIQRVHFYGDFIGYDENGDGATRDWHGMTKEKTPVGHLGTVETYPYSVAWDTSMLPAQDGVRVRAAIEIQPAPELVAREQRQKEENERYWRGQELIVQSSPSDRFSISHPPGISVESIVCQNQSIPFWSRANRIKEGEFLSNIDPQRIERACLDIVVWDGGAGTIKDPFALNGHPVEVTARGGHDTIYSHVEIAPNWLQRGTNKATLRSDTQHHGIEVLFPGPVLTIRYRHDEPTNRKQ